MKTFLWWIFRFALLRLMGDRCVWYFFLYRDENRECVSGKCKINLKFNRCFAKLNTQKMFFESNELFSEYPQVRYLFFFLDIMSFSYRILVHVYIRKKSNLKTFFCIDTLIIQNEDYARQPLVIFTWIHVDETVKSHKYSI